jgi:acetyl esterase
MADDDVDSDLRRCQDMMQEAYARLPAFDPLSVDDLRRVTAIVRAPWTEGGPTMKRTEEKHVGDYSTRIRIYYPDDNQILPALIYIHGGGWTIFSLDTHDRLMREYAGRAKIVVIGVDYSLSPEVKYPRAINEIVSVVQWLRKQNSTELGIDVRRIVIGGDSAGANLSVATNLHLRTLNKPILTAQLLNYGVYDRARPESDSYMRYGGPKYRLTAAEVHFFQKNYVRDERDFDDPLVCPLHADLHGLPPSFLAIAECDILADENRAMTEALRNANVVVEEHIYGGAAHSFLEAVRIAAISSRALDEAAHWLGQQLSNEIRDSH